MGLPHSRSTTQYNMEYQICPLDVSKLKHHNWVVEIHNTGLKHAQKHEPHQGSCDHSHTNWK